MAGWPTIREREREGEREEPGEGSSSSVHRRKHILTTGLHKPEIRLFVIPTHTHTHTQTQSMIQGCIQMFYACQCALQKGFRLNCPMSFFWALDMLSLNLSLSPHPSPSLSLYQAFMCNCLLFPSHHFFFVPSERIELPGTSYFMLRHSLCRDVNQP